MKNKPPKTYPIEGADGAFGAEIDHDERLTPEKRAEFVKSSNVDQGISRLQGVLSAFTEDEDPADASDEDKAGGSSGETTSGSPFLPGGVQPEDIAPQDPQDTEDGDVAHDEVGLTDARGDDTDDVESPGEQSAPENVTSSEGDIEEDTDQSEGSDSPAAPHSAEDQTDFTLSGALKEDEDDEETGDELITPPPATTSIDFEEATFVDASPDEVEAHLEDARQIVSAHEMEDAEVEKDPYEGFQADAGEVESTDDAEDVDDIEDGTWEESMNEMMEQMRDRSRPEDADPDQDDETPDDWFNEDNQADEIVDIGAGDGWKDLPVETSPADGEGISGEDFSSAEAESPDVSGDETADAFEEIFAEDADVPAAAMTSGKGGGSDKDTPGKAAKAEKPPKKKGRFAPLLFVLMVFCLLAGVGYLYVSPMIDLAPQPIAKNETGEKDVATTEETGEEAGEEVAGSLLEDEDLRSLGLSEREIYERPERTDTEDIKSLFSRSEETGETVDASRFSLPQEQIDLLASAEDIDKLIEMFQSSEDRIAELEDAVASRDAAIAERDQIMLEIAKTAREAEALALATTEIITDVVRLQGSMGTAEKLIVDLSHRIAALEQVDPADRATINRRIDDINARLKSMARDLGLLARLATEPSGPKASPQPTAPVPGALSVYEDARGAVAPAPTAGEIPSDVKTGDVIDGYGEVLDVMETSEGKRLVVMENASVMID